MVNNLILELLIEAMGASIIATQLIQKIKETISFGKKFNKILSIFISLTTGYLYAVSFYKAEPISAAWIALFTLIGAETMYKTFTKKYSIHLEKR